MPITQAAKKDIRKNARRRVMNLERKNKVKGLIKQAKGLIAEKKPAEAEKLLPSIYKALDKAAKKNTIKKNTASRKKARMAAMVSRAKKAS